jgi:hypothetical protein
VLSNVEDVSCNLRDFGSEFYRTSRQRRVRVQRQLQEQQNRRQQRQWVGWVRFEAQSHGQPYSATLHLVFTATPLLPDALWDLIDLLLRTPTPTDSLPIHFGVR